MMDDLDGALEDYNKTIELNPEYVDAYLNRGCLKRELKDYKGALEDFNKALELNPQFKEAKKGRTLCYFKMKKPFKAIKSFFEK